MKTTTRMLAAVLTVAASLTASAIVMNDGGYLITENNSGHSPFVFLEMKKNPAKGYEQGMNSGVRDYLDSTKGEYVPITSLGSIDGTVFSGLGVTPGNYIELQLGVNQEGNQPINLTTLRLFTSLNQIPSSQLDTVFDPVDDGLGLAKWSYTGTLVVPDGGSGNSDRDLTVLVPLSAIGTEGYLYLYSQCGPASGTGTSPNDGNEKWGAYYGPQTPLSTPDASNTLMLLGMGLTVLGALKRRLS